MEVSTLTQTREMSGLRGPSALLRLQSDERLIMLTRRGQHAAFETLCSRYQSRLLSFCRHMLNSREDAEDVLQEVFTAAFNAVLADDRAINVKPWLYRIARNRSLNHLRRASATGVDSMDIHFAEHGISTSDKVLKRESFRELIADVHDLPETQRTALLLREIDALSYDQIAVAMDTTVPSVKSLLVRARISLAEAAESRKLSCEEVRLELGAVAEGLTKLSTAGRRHVRGCERCAFFKKQLKENNHALAAILPVGPLLLVKKFFFAKLGSTASAGGAHATVGAGATVGVGAAAGAGAAAGGGSVAGGLLTAGAGALATKAVAGLAAAAIVTAGAVAADHAASTSVHHHPNTQVALSASAASVAPVVYHQVVQPATAGATALPRHDAITRRHHLVRELAAAKAASKAAKAAPATVTVASPAATTPTAVPVTPAAAPAAQPVQVTEVSTTTTALPTAATEASTGSTPPPAEASTAPSPSLPTAEPVNPPAGGASTGAQGETGGTQVEASTAPGTPAAPAVPAVPGS
jgi:RNA polymerase sigma factor (sigma-70 family)